MILMRDRRPEQCHNAVARVLIDRPFEAVDPVGEDGEELIHDLVPLFRIYLFGEVHRALHVGEEDGYLLPLALEGAPRSKDLLGEVFRGVGTRIALRRFLRSTGQRLPALAAKSFARLILGAARGTGESQACAAPGTEFSALPILATAG